MALGLSEPFIEPYGNIYINSQAWYGLEPMAAGVGYLWTSMDLFTNAGTIELHEVELSNEVGEEATIRCTVDAPPDFERSVHVHAALSTSTYVFSEWGELALIGFLCLCLCFQRVCGAP